jgi:hypothetical protein
MRMLIEATLRRVGQDPRHDSRMLLVRCFRWLQELPGEVKEAETAGLTIREANLQLKSRISFVPSMALSLLYFHSMFEGESYASTASITLMVLQYLMSNPGAKDTLEGIRKWWIATTRQEPRTDELQAVLDELMQKGWVVRFKPTGSKHVYGLNKECLQEIQDSIQDLGPSARSRA